MKNFNYTIVAVMAAISLSCERNFDDFRVVENALTEVEVRFEVSSILNMMHVNGVYNVFKTGEYAQLYAFRNFETRQFISTDNFSGNQWKDAYNLLPTINDVIERTEPGVEGAFAPFNAIGKITKVYVMSILTDGFGDIPYFEAGLAPKDTDKIFPPYDSQQEIYSNFFKLLDEAIAGLSSSSNFSLQNIDRMYNGNVSKWLKFANSLRLRLAMRVRFVDSGLATQEIQKALGTDLMENNGDSAINRSVQSSVWINDQGAASFRMSERIIHRLVSTKDPRLPLYADLNKVGEYAGLPNGILIVEDDDLFSDIGDGISKANTADVLFLYSEVAFLKAEAYLFGIGTAADPTAANREYRTGIESSMQFWGVSQEQIDAFLATPIGTLSGSDEEKFEMLIEQKWLALINNGPEAYNEFRRTGYPKIPTRTDATKFYLGDTNGVTPVRSPYPNDEAVNNTDNYEMAANATNGNSILHRVWWDVD